MNTTAQQVIFCYLRRPLVWGMLAGSVLFTLSQSPMLFLAARGKTGGSAGDSFMPGHGAMVMAFAPMMMGMVVGAMLKRQFGEARAQLTPGFARPHIAVAVGILILFCVLLPAMMAALAGVSIIGSMAIGASLAALMLWYTYSMSGALTMLFLFGWFSFYIPPIVRAVYEPLMNGSADLYATGVFIGMVAACYFALKRFATLTEDDPCYHKHIHFGGFDLRGRQAMKERRQWTSGQMGRWTTLMQRNAYKFDRPAGAGRGLLAEAMLWRIGLSPQSPMAMGIMMGAIVAISMYGIGGIAARVPTPDAEEMANPALMIILLQWVIAMPGMLVAGQYTMAWDRLQQISMRPVHRSRMAILLLTAALIDTWQLTGILLLFGLGSVYAFQTVSITGADAIALTVIALLAQVFAVGAMMIGVSLRSMVANMIVGMPVMLVLMGIGAAWWFGKMYLGEWVTGLTIGVLLAMGAGAMLASHKRWCAVEFG